LILVFSAPALIAGVLGLLEGGVWPYLSLAAGVVIGLAVLAGGVAWGGRIFDRRGPEILAFAMRN
jgi:ABC-2 type transport system permease protein